MLILCRTLKLDTQLPSKPHKITLLWNGVWNGYEKVVSSMPLFDILGTETEFKSPSVINSHSGFPLFLFLLLPHIWPKFVVSMLYKLEDVPWLLSSRPSCGQLETAGDRMWRGPGIWREMTRRWVGSGSEETNSNFILDTALQEPTWPYSVRQGLKAKVQVPNPGTRDCS